MYVCTCIASEMQQEKYSHFRWWNAVCFECFGMERVVMAFVYSTFGETKEYVLYVITHLEEFHALFHFTEKYGINSMSFYQKNE